MFGSRPHHQLLVSPCVFLSLVFLCLSLCLLLCVVVCDGGMALPSWLLVQPSLITAHSTHLLCSHQLINSSVYLLQLAIHSSPDRCFSLCGTHSQSYSSCCTLTCTYLLLPVPPGSRITWSSTCLPASPPSPHSSPPSSGYACFPSLAQPSTTASLPSAATPPHLPTVREILKSRLTWEWRSFRRPGCLTQKHLLKLGQGEWRLSNTSLQCSATSILKEVSWKTLFTLILSK